MDKINNFFGGLKQKIEKSYEKSLWKWVLICFITALAEEFILEILGRRSIIEGFKFIIQSPVIYIYNALIVFFTLLLALLLKKRFFFLSFIAVLWLVCGIVNFTVLGYRITPFSAIDLLMVTDVFSMLDVYYTSFQQVLLFAAILLVIAILVFMYIKTPKVKEKLNYIHTVLICLGAFAVVYVFTLVGIKTKLVSDDFANLGMAYENYGFAYCFSNSVIDVGMDEPDGYSEEAVLEIKDKLNDDIRTGNRKRPNVIFVQLESFIDIDRVSGIETDKDPVSNFNRLMERYPSGYITVPSIGAGTANTEFEVLTGMKSSFFGAGEYPYKTVLSETPTESLAQIFQRQGYGTHAIHNNKGVFYDRNKVFANMGFDSFTSLEYMYDVNYTSTGWAKDDVLVDEIMKALKSTREKDFIFTVSVQGHGRYPTEELGCEEHVKLTREDGNIELQNQFGYYVNQTYEMDIMIQELIDELNASGESYVLVLYGDHIPSLEFEEGQITEGTDFQTEYVIVNNVGLMLDDKDIYAYELSDYILSALNLDKGYIQKLHSVYYNNDNTEEFEKALYMIQYDILYGEHYIYQEDDPYERADMSMGIDTISITDVSYENDEIIVTGENFNEFSVIIMNDDRLETEYVDRNTIKVISDEVKDKPDKGDIFRVEQVDKEKHTLSSTDDFVY